ncbi:MULTISPECIES: DMT family transporter [Streptomyces]|uniref:DMT family transporter n=1 Tax=Streptomyces odorifer TaxID=53450 RepID=A0A7Y6C8S2_9ACTN|nr:MULTISPECIES: DMT family transporter [Streptomyces]NUV32938.1 DMT family transporter [Streptomyces sp. KAI-27]NUV46532.1 DMT family transporter [Streptomyces sp. CAI-78]MCG5122860.1 DMT family transporter [Streptomyces sp. T7(2022)]MCR0986847.1 DMT family transporter [Streptomyces albidoflavus]NUV28028.1 DMT family transporter [Streptomyces odorifer]
MRVRVGAQFVALACAWGSSFLFIKIGLEGLTPAQVVWGRLVLGAVALCVVMAVTRGRIPRDPGVWLRLSVVSVLLCVVPFLLFSWAEQHLDSGMASILNATTPLLTLAVGAVALAGERLGRRGTAGLLAGFAGVLVLIGPGGLAGGQLTAVLACLGATSCYGVAFVYLRRYVTPLGLPAVSVAFVQVVIGAAVMLAATPWLAEPAPRVDARIAVAMVALGALSTGLAYLWNANIVQAWGAVNASAVTYLTPVVGVTAGVLLLGEQLTWNQPLGAALVVAGIVAAHGSPVRGRRRQGKRETATPVAEAGAGRPD